MRCPTLSELPPPPPGKAGWPWTEGSSLFATESIEGSIPAISVVTPSYNQGQFLEETIRSVLLQGYPNLEYIVIDGGSTDSSLEVIRKYERWLAFWASEKDRGQSHAINKGWQRVTGEISTWLNSDDVYLRNTLQHVAAAFATHPDAQMVYGDSILIDARGTVEGQLHTPAFSLRELLTVNFVPQPSTFLKTAAVKAAGYLDESLHLCMDYRLWLDIAVKNEVRRIDHILSAMRLHGDSKTCTQLAKMNVELADIVDSFLERNDLSANLQMERTQILARQLLVAGSAEWFNGATQEGAKLIDRCDHSSLRSEDVAVILANAAVYFSRDPQVQLDRFFQNFHALKGAHALAGAWVAVLAARKLPHSELRYGTLWSSLRSARTRRIARAVFPLMLAKTFGTRAGGLLSGLKRSYDGSPVGLSLSQLP